MKGLKLIKVRGSSFFGYVKDEYTTLPESYDRPLFIFLNIEWRYNDLEDARGNTTDGYVGSEQVRDIAYTVFHEENSPSIQNLIYRIGYRILERFPQLIEVRFESNNRTWETILDEIPSSEEGKVFTEPRPPYGFQCFSMTREDLENRRRNRLMAGRVTTHVLDLSKGKPAAGIFVELWEVVTDNEFTRIQYCYTNEDGRVEKPLIEGSAMKKGIYELRFHVGDYYQKRGGITRRSCISKLCSYSFRDFGTCRPLSRAAITLSRWIQYLSWKLRCADGYLKNFCKGRGFL